MMVVVHVYKINYLSYLKWLWVTNLLVYCCYMYQGLFWSFWWYIKAQYSILILQVQFLPWSHDWNWSLQQRYERTTTREGFCHCCLRLDCPLVVLCVPLFWYQCLWFWCLLYTYVISGYIAYNFVIGAYSYWGPKAGQEIYNMVKCCVFN